MFGARRLDLIEAGVQEAFVAAIEQWRDPTAVPAEPGAWLQTVARRKVVDALRRAAWFAPNADRELDALEAPPSADTHGDDALLAMMFVCCHPALLHGAKDQSSAACRARERSGALSCRR